MGGMTDVKSTYVTATGQALVGPKRVRALQFTGGAAAATITMRDGGAGGTITHQFNVEIDAQGHMEMPARGIVFKTDVHVTLGDAAQTLAIIYDG